MSTTLPIWAIINKAKLSSKLSEPAEFLEDCQRALYEDFAQPGNVDPFIGWQNVHSYYCTAAEILYENKFLWAAEQLLCSGWNYLGNRQLKEKKKTYRAAFSYELAKLYILSEDKGTALRWALLSHADDMLGEHEAGGGASKEWLLTALGMSRYELSKLDEIAAENVKEIREERSNDWSKPAAFAEDVLVRLMLSSPELAHLFAMDTNTYEFPITQSYFKTLMVSVNTAADTNEKGNSLECLASYIFSLIPGWVPRRNVLHEDLSFETDIVVSNLNRAGNLAAELLGRHFLVECKNWSSKNVGVSEVGYFLYRMRLTHTKFGVLLVSNKITGKDSEDDEKAARSLIRKAFHEDGSICIDLNKKDLNDLLEGRSFWGMLLERIEVIRFGKSKDFKKKSSKVSRKTKGASKKKI